MGGQSFKCPYCDYWKLSMAYLRQHLRDKHGRVECVIKGVGSGVEVVSCKFIEREGVKDHG